VHDVVGLIINGASVEDVCRSFPDLSRAQVYECLAYYEDHRTEIDALVAEQITLNAELEPPRYLTGDIPLQPGTRRR
jgi:uncharacterized protein DUF433